MVHLLTLCRATAETRTRVMANLLNTLSVYFPDNQILTYPNHEHLTQLNLDPTSLNLPLTIRISPDHPALQCVLAVYLSVSSSIKNGLFCYTHGQNEAVKSAQTIVT